MGHTPEHSPVFFMPSLYPVFPLFLCQFEQLKDSDHTHTKEHRIMTGKMMKDCQIAQNCFLKKKYSNKE